MRSNIQNSKIRGKKQGSPLTAYSDLWVAPRQDGKDSKGKHRGPREGLGRRENWAENKGQMTFPTGDKASVLGAM